MHTSDSTRAPSCNPDEVIAFRDSLDFYIFATFLTCDSLSQLTSTATSSPPSISEQQQLAYRSICSPVQARVVDIYWNRRFIEPEQLRGTDIALLSFLLKTGQLFLFVRCTFTIMATNARALAGNLLLYKITQLNFFITLVSSASPDSRLISGLYDFQYRPGSSSLRFNSRFFNFGP